MMDSRFPYAQQDMEKQMMGLKVICIDDSFSDEQIANCSALPIQGDTYTVRAVRFACRQNDQPEMAILLNEIVNARLIYGKEPAFWFDRFEHDDSDD